MKKQIVAIGLIMITVFTVTACGSSQKEEAANPSVTGKAVVESMATKEPVESTTTEKKINGIKDIKEILGVSMTIPEEVEDVTYEIADENIGKISFTYGQYKIVYVGSKEVKGTDLMKNQGKEKEDPTTMSIKDINLEVHYYDNGGKMVVWSENKENYAVYSEDITDNEVFIDMLAEMVS